MAYYRIWGAWKEKSKSAARDLTPCVASSVWRHLCGAICVASSVWRHLCGVICVASSVWRHLCGVICV